MNNVITNPVSPIPVNKKSHVYGWTSVWAEQLSALINHKCTEDILNADIVYIDHGVNFSGSLNLFGGADKGLFDRFNTIMECDNVISLDHDMPKYGEMLKKRIGAKSTYEGITETWCDKVTGFLDKCQSLKQEDLTYPNVILGDSHTISFSDKNDRLFRNDGKTLNGVLKVGLSNMMRGVKPEKLTLSFGSIDIRHHFMRHGITGDKMDDMLKEYIKQGDAIASEVYYCAPVPVEFEGRKIPKSGFYKGMPFYGSVQERHDLTNEFIERLGKLSGGRVIMPPEAWYSMDKEDYAKTYMELNSSFHIAPLYYRRNDWGIPVAAFDDWD
jgi:hypothetical protein